MDPLSIKAFFFPTQVIFVDDDFSYINTIISLLNNYIASFTIYEDPDSAADYLLKTYRPTHFLEQIISRPEAGLNQTNITLDIQEIFKIIYNPKRFSEISVVVTDFNMPQQTGQELCEKLAGSVFNKLMITSEAGEGLAIELFNNSIINKFIKKVRALNAEIPFIDKLQKMIVGLQEDYFDKQSHDIITNLSSANGDKSIAFTDNDFLQVFKKIAQAKNICEYYLIDTTGSFLLLTPTAKQSYLLLQSPDDMRTAIELVEYSSNPNLEVLNALKNGEKILYWNPEHGFPDTAEQQLLHTYPAQKLGNHFYSYVDDRNILNIEREKITSFRQFMASKVHSTKFY